MGRARSRFPKKMDNLIWDGTFLRFSAIGSGSTALQFSSVGTQPTTLLRLRGNISVIVDGLEAPAVAARATWGLIKVPDGSATTVQYDPVADVNAPWIYWGSAVIGYEEYVTDVIDCPGISSYREVVDNKAMRRIRPDEELQWVLTNTTVDGGLSLNHDVSIRWLQGF